jgi:hypothetical protein
MNSSHSRQSICFASNENAIVQQYIKAPSIKRTGAVQAEIEIHWMTAINMRLKAGQLSEFGLERRIAGQRFHEGVKSENLLDFGQTHFRSSFAGILRAVFAEAFGAAFGRGTL